MDKESNMVTIIYEYDVPVEKKAEYIQATKEKIKPFWESIGCTAYDIWQVAESETKFIKTMVFEDMPTMKESVNKKEADPFKELWYTFAENVSRKICEKKT
jgi:quinol monooxygenase YgiN